LQAYEVYLVQQAARRAELAQGAGDQEFLAQAPIVLVFCTHAMRAESRYRERGSELYCIQDATIACTFAMLAATALGLSSVWVGAFDEKTIRKSSGRREQARSHVTGRLCRQIAHRTASAGATHSRPREGGCSDVFACPDRHGSRSGIGFLLTSPVLFLVIARGRQAITTWLVLLICVIWDLGMFLSM
jgi:hypothetical protein